MSECDTSLNPLDGSLVDLKIGEQTLERITELGNLSSSDISLDAVRGSDAEPLDLSLKDTSSSSFILNYLNGSNLTEESEKINELRQSVNSILSSNGLPVHENTDDGSYLGISAKVAEILLQHGEFPAPRNIDKIPFNSINGNLIKDADTSPSAFKRFKSNANSNRPTEILSMASLPSLMSWGFGEGESPSAKLTNNLNDINRYSLHNVPQASWTSTNIPSLLLNHRPFPSITPFGHISDSNQNLYNHIALGHENPPIIHNQSQEVSKNQIKNVNDTHRVKHELKTSPKHSLIQMVALDKSTNAFKSHPLYPLLRDLATADYYFDHVDFDVAPLLAFLPSSPREMIKVFLEQHPEANKNNKHYDYQSDAIDSVIMDAIHFAHKTLLDRVRKLQMNAVEDINAELASTEEVVETFCKQFMDVIKGSTPLNISHASNSSHILNIPNENTTKRAKSPDSYFQQPKQFSPIYPTKSPQNCSDASLNTYDDRRRNTSHHSKEAVKILTQWLKEHCDNPYPNEQEKRMLADMVGLTQQQVAHWFINARRRLLPKLRDSMVNKKVL